MTALELLKDYCKRFCDYEDTCDDPGCPVAQVRALLAEQPKAGEQQIYRRHYDYVQGLRAKIDCLEKKYEELKSWNATLQSKHTPLLYQHEQLRAQLTAKDEEIKQLKKIR